MLPLHTILFDLPATHTRFFDMLEGELEKVETFYAEREKEMQELAKRLREQLNELGVHRQMFYVGHYALLWVEMYATKLGRPAVVYAREVPKLGQEGTTFCSIHPCVCHALVAWPRHAESGRISSNWPDGYISF